MQQVTISLPQGVSISELDVRMILAGKLFEEGKLTSGQAAEWVGISKRDFVERLGNYGFSPFGYDFDELKEDLSGA